MKFPVGKRRTREHIIPDGDLRNYATVFATRPEVPDMTRKSTVTFAELRHLLEGLGYRHDRVERGEIFHLSADREIYFRRYAEREFVFARDLAKTRSFLDAWGQLDAADFDTFLETTPKPA